MAIADDITITYSSKRIGHSSGATIYTVNELYSYLQSEFDDLDQMDDTIPMSAQTPTEYTLINAWYMNQTRGAGSPDENMFEYLKTGAVQTIGWTGGEVRMKAYDASGGTAFIAGDLDETITETDSGDTGIIIDFDVRTGADIGYVWIHPVDVATDTFADTNSAYTVSNSSAAGVFTAESWTGENLWPNIYTLGSIQEDLTEAEEQQMYIEQDGSRVFSGSEWWPELDASATTRHMDILIKTREAGTEINGGLVTVFLRHYQTQPTATNPADLYDHFEIDISAGGRNAVPLATANDLNNTSYQSTISGYTDVIIAFVNGTVSYSAISGSFTNFEEAQWDGGTGIFLYQTTASGAGTMTLGNVDTSDWPLNGDTITGGSSGFTALADADMVEAYKMARNFAQGSDYNYSVIVNCATRPLTEVYEYLKYVTRVGATYTTYPTTYPEGGPLSHSTLLGQLYIRAHEDTQTSPTNEYSPVKASPFGTFAGGKFFGAQGVWVQNMDSADVQNFQLIDSEGTTRTPPNQQSITISNLLSDDRISVFRSTGSGSTVIERALYTSDTGNDTSDGDFVVKEDIAVDTPTTGVIRVVDIDDITNSREERYTYTSWTSKTFTLSGTLDRQYTETDDTVYVPFIDAESSGTSVSVTVIYTTDRTLLLRVRRYTATAILPFETTGTFLSTGYTQGAIRTTDSIVN